jgi:prepilin-type processing-associated H-X9-DG protein
MYVGEFHHYLLGQEWGQAALTGSGGKFLPYLAHAYGVFVCPEKQREVKSNGRRDPFDLFSYGYNGAGTAPDGRDFLLGMGLLHRISETRIKVPSDMIVAGDSGINSSSNYLLSPNEIPGLNESAVPGNPQLPSNRHDLGANVLFCDGHVAYGKQQKWTEKTSHSRCQWNNDNEPHPETW